MNEEIEDDYIPDWAEDAANNPHKPNWIDGIPHKLWVFGEVFFPIPRGKKGWNWPHHIKRFRADDEIFNAYLEAGSGYGIVCAEDLTVVDVDDTVFLDYITDKLPETLWQITGSREGYHLFYFCENQDSRITLRIPYSQNHMVAEGHRKDVMTTSSPHSGYRHLGEVKADEHGYVVGTGSVHPSGNKYGPLKGDTIERISKEKLQESLKVFINESSDDGRRRRRRKKDYDVDSEHNKYQFFNLDADDVVPWLEPEKRVPHPGHGSRSGMNFMKNGDRETFVCWRHDYGGTEGCVLSPLQLLAQIETGGECDEIRANWPYYDEKIEIWRGDMEMYWYAWKQAVEKGLVKYDSLPYRVIKGFALHNDWIREGEEVSGKLYWDTVNIIKCIMEEPHIPDEEVM